MSESVPPTPSAPAESSTPSFTDLLPDTERGAHLLAALTAVGYESPSPIQAQTIPLLLSGRDVVGLAQTGTGKTAAFALPILAEVDLSRRTPQALVLTPTRELALQVAEAFTRYASHLPRDGTDTLQVLPIYGGAGYPAQLSGLRRGAQIVVGTPGRLIDHLESGALDLSALDYLVLDEADEMLRMGFAEDVDKILARTPEYKQVALFSATLPKQIKTIAKRHLHDPAEVRVVSETMTVQNTRQRWMLVSHHAKLDALTRVLETETGDAMIIFVRTKQGTEELADKLRARGFAATAINGDLAQQQRERTIGQLRDGSLDILVATDVAARGLDVDRISHVVNYDIPHDTEAYVHRIGRTGRAGRSGDALLFVTPRERRLLGSIEKVTRQKLTQVDIPSVEDVNARRAEKFGGSIGQALDSPALPQFRELVQAYVAEHDVSELDAAAALAVQAYSDGDFWLAPDPEPSRSARERRDGDRPDRAARSDRPDRPDRPSKDGLVEYRIAVGKRHKITPGSIVGALCNEGRLHRSDFGAISIRPDHTLVQLPPTLPPGTEERLARTRISGQLIKLTRDDGPPSGRPGATKKKPRTKKKD